MIEVKLTFAGQAELVAFFAGTPQVANQVAKTPTLISTQPALAAAAEPAKEAAKVAPPKQAPAATPTAVAAETSAPPAAAAASPSDAVVDYKTLQKAVFALAAKSREAVTGQAAKFGVTTFKDLDQSRWAEALSSIGAALDEINNPVEEAA